MHKAVTTKRVARKKRWTGSCIYKVRELYSPIMREFRGLRILVAVPNMDGRVPFKDIPAPSFNRAYMIFMSSDYDPSEVEEKLAEHIKWLRSQGFEKIEEAGEYQARMLLQMGYLEPIAKEDLAKSDDDEETEEAAIPSNITKMTPVSAEETMAEQERLMKELGLS